MKTIRTRDIRLNLAQEGGFALVLVLVILMTLTIFGIGVLTSSTTNTAMSRNFLQSTEARNMAEIGLYVGYREFINAGFLKTTHTENMADVQTGMDLLETELQNYTVDADGNYVWEWDDGKGYSPLFDTDIPHGFKYRIFYSSSNAFVIESEGWYGNIHKRMRARGEVESMFQFSYFASRDLGEFTRGAAQELRGKIHANGNMYIRPSGSTLSLNSSSVTATGFIVRSRDAWGRPDSSGECLITKNSEDSGIWVEMQPGAPRGSEGLAFDSYHADWSDKDVGARALWGGVVRDKVPYKSPPPIENLDKDGYYDQEAELHITANTYQTKSWCSLGTFWNYNEQRWEIVQDIDMAALGSISSLTRGLISTDSSTQTILIDGNVASEYIVGERVDITNSSGGVIDGRYTIASLSHTGPNTQIVVNEPIADTIGDGSLYWSVLQSDGGMNTITVSGQQSAKVVANDLLTIQNSTTAALNGVYTITSAIDTGDSTVVTVTEPVTGGATDGAVFLTSTSGAKSDFPSNGLIYCEVPTRFYNASLLEDKLMVASKDMVYLKGNFNTTDKKGASILTKKRIYILSNNFSDIQSTNSKYRAASDTQVNAAMVDGAPTVDEYNWCDRDGDHRYDDSSIRIYDDWDNKTAAGFNNPNNSGDPWANCDDLVEDWGGKVLRKHGSVVHLGETYDIMCPNLDNSGLTADQLAWIRRLGYNPPTRVYTYDPDLATASGQPPYTPMIGHITSWTPF